MNRLFILIILFGPTLLFCQNPDRFQTEYDSFLEKDTKKLSEEGSLSTDCLFVGSSSIRFWTSLPEDYPDVKLLNRGFGGSHMSDLLTMRESLISKYKPNKILIYEGDNDIADGEHIAEIKYEQNSCWPIYSTSFLKQRYIYLQQNQVFLDGVF